MHSFIHSLVHPSIRSFKIFFQCQPFHSFLGMLDGVFVCGCSLRALKPAGNFRRPFSGTASNSRKPWICFETLCYVSNAWRSTWMLKFVRWFVRPPQREHRPYAKQTPCSYSFLHSIHFHSLHSFQAFIPFVHTPIVHSKHSFHSNRSRTH